MNISEFFLWAFVLNLGIAFGAGLYETKIILPQWFKKTGSEYLLDSKSMRETEKVLGLCDHNAPYFAYHHKPGFCLADFWRIAKLVAWCRYNYLYRTSSSIRVFYTHCA
ncbi:MAG: hypothetical protein H7329_08665 [Opitutaceae bacterium]|nr:hypothetical protein [Cytophagales bacterium]